MTLLEINLTDVLSETDPDDRVVVWAPVFREGPAGQLVGPRRKSIPLVDGVGSDEVVPGPLMVQVQCKAMSDTRPREVVVPEVGPVTLTDLLHETFTYTPAVVNESLTQITTARDDALADVDGAVDQALAGSQRYSGTGFPEGKVAAPVGSIYTDTLATAGAVRWVKTSGTGNTGWRVEYGDTGRRNITASIPSENVKSGAVYIGRSQNTVSVRFIGFSSDVSARATILTLPPGFRPDHASIYNVPAYWGGHTTTVVQVSPDGSIGFKDTVSEGAVNSVHTFMAAASTSWPTTLPGTPV